MNALCTDHDSAAQLLSKAQAICVKHGASTDRSKKLARVAVVLFEVGRSCMEQASNRLVWLIEDLIHASDAHMAFAKKTVDELKLGLAIDDRSAVEDRIAAAEAAIGGSLERLQKREGIVNAARKAFDTLRVRVDAVVHAELTLQVEMSNAPDWNAEDVNFFPVIEWDRSYPADCYFLCGHLLYRAARRTDPMNISQPVDFCAAGWVLVMDARG